MDTILKINTTPDLSFQYYLR